MTYLVMKRGILALMVVGLFLSCTPKKTFTNVLHFKDYTRYFEEFNANDVELYTQFVPNDSAASFLKQHIPLLDIPDSTIQRTYYFRWWTFRKHIKETPDGFVITEFLPKVSWSGQYNTINCPAAHHIYEGRWLRNERYVKDYIKFWLNDADHVRKYSFWVADATWSFLKVHKDSVFMDSQLSNLIANYQGWERERRDGPNRLFWQNDNMDGMELSAGGRIINGGKEKFQAVAVRPTINSYMFGDAKAIADMAGYLGKDSVARVFKENADHLQELVEKRLWNDSLEFFSQLPRDYTKDDNPLNIRELIGYIPWYFKLPKDSKKYIPAWERLLDSTAFYAPYGLTTVERAHPYFKISYQGHECQWNGPSWPFATTQTLKALSNFLNDYKMKGNLNNKVYQKLLLQYAKAHSITWDDGTSQPWIDENINPFDGDWISRTRLKQWKDGNWSSDKGGEERGKDYNHSGFCDLVINDLIGFKPQWDGSVVIKPLVPDTWNWFCLDRLNYQGRELTIIWDKDGSRYNQGAGFQVWLDGEVIHARRVLGSVKIQ